MEGAISVDNQESSTDCIVARTVVLVLNMNVWTPLLQRPHAHF